MYVSSVLSTLGVTATGMTSKSKIIQTDGETTPAATEDVYSSKIAEIAAKYDPSHISLDQVPEFGKELYAKGLISSSANGIMMGLPGIVKILARDGQSLGGLDIGTDGDVNLIKYSDSMVPYQRTHEATVDVEQTASTFKALASYKHSQINSNNAVSAQNTLNFQGARSAYKAGIQNSSLDAQKVLEVLQALVTSRKNSAVF